MIGKKHKSITIGLLALTGSLLLTTASTAGSKPPWIVPETGITKSQSFIAARMKKALAIERRKHPLDRPPKSVKWTTTARNWGISNIDVNNINKLFSGHYFVAVNQPYSNRQYYSTERISVEYFGKDGEYFSCEAVHRYAQNIKWRGIWKASKKTIGFGGLNIRKNKKVKEYIGLPVLYDNYTGRTLRYIKPGNSTNRPIKFVGHFQKEYAPVFGEVCPNIPNNGSVNVQQFSPIYAEFVKDARIIKNIPTRFKQDIDNPLTLGMYFSLYGPDE